MIWNWRQPDWPNFDWQPVRLRRAEDLFLLEGGTLAGAVKHLGAADREQVEVESMSVEAITTSEIEGEILDRASVQSSIRRQLGLATDGHVAAPKEEGIAGMMVDLHRSFVEPLSDEKLGEWHRLVVKGRSDVREIGRYRSDPEPMRVVSGAVYEPKVHFEAPPSEAVPGEMAYFLEWFNRTAPDGPSPLPALIRAGVAHLYFESIHPFEDGNGRIGRAISEKSLAQSMRRPTLIALAATILIRRKEYYAALGRASRSNEITDWLAWFAAITIEAQRRATAQIEFLIDKTKLLDTLRGRLNERQEGALLRMLREGLGGFQGGLSAGNYARITGASPATATRDLSDLVAQGALNRTGERRYARYVLPFPPREVSALTIDESGEVR